MFTINQGNDYSLFMEGGGVVIEKESMEGTGVGGQVLFLILVMVAIQDLLGHTFALCSFSLMYTLFYYKNILTHLVGQCGSTQENKYYLFYTLGSLQICVRHLLYWSNIKVSLKRKMNIL